MPKPDWLREREGERDRRRPFKRCMNCEVGGDVCGQTNYLPKEGRLNMYRCRKHPTIKFWRDTLACEDFRPRHMT